MSTTSQIDHPPVRLAGRTLKQSRHICAFFNSREEQNKLLMPFFKEGLERNERVFHIIDARLRDEHLHDCRNHGIDVDGVQGSGQLEVRHWEEAYLQDGYFDKNRMVKTLCEALDRGRERYKITRLMANMEWALEALPGVTDIVEYETMLNYALPKYPDPVVCVYDLNRHSGSVVMDILRTHPMVIIGGILQDNPLYIPPDQFLQELRERKALMEERRADC